MTVRGAILALVTAGCGAASPTAPARAPAPVTVAAPLVPDGASAEERVMLELINDYRRRAGVAPVALDLAFSQGCREHASYLVINRGKPQLYHLNAHRQDPSLPGATPAGAECGGASDITHNAPSLSAAVHGWMGTLLHRGPILAAYVDRVGVGSAQLPGGHYVVVLRFGIRRSTRASRRPRSRQTAKRGCGWTSSTRCRTAAAPARRRRLSVHARLLASRRDHGRLGDVRPRRRHAGAVPPVHAREAGEHLLPAAGPDRRDPRRGAADEHALHGDRQGYVERQAAHMEVDLHDDEPLEVDAADKAALFDAVGQPILLRGVVDSASKISDGTISFKLAIAPGVPWYSVDVQAPLAMVKALTKREPYAMKGMRLESKGRRCRTSPRRC
jgi:uncharacterized protein YkwD